MKPTLKSFIIVLAIAQSSLAHAQQILIGPHAEVLYNRARFEAPNNHLKTPYGVGRAFGLSMTTTSATRVNIVVDLTYRTVKNSFESNVPQYGDLKIQSDYFSLPTKLMLESLPFGKNGAYKLAVFAGPEISYFFSGRTEYTGENGKVTASIPINRIVSGSRRFQYGYQAGLTMLRTIQHGRMAFSVRYNGGFSKQVDRITIAEYQDYEDLLAFKNSSFSFSTTYFIDFGSTGKKKKNSFVNPKTHWKTDM